MIAELAALALSCAPDIHPITLHALVRHESRAKQYAIGVNRKGQHLPRQPQTLAEATEAAQRLIDQGIDFDAGLGQINVRNWEWLKLDTATVFDPCRNLAAAQTVLADCYARAAAFFASTTIAWTAIIWVASNVRYIASISRNSPKLDP